MQKRITELTQLEKSFNSKKYDFENNMRRSENRVKAFENQVEILKKTIPFLSTIPKDEKGEFIFSAKVAGQTFSKVGEFGTAMIAEAEPAKKYKPAGDTFILGELWNFKILGKVEHSFLENKNHVNREVISPFGDKIGEAKELPAGEIAAGLQIKQAILDMPQTMERFIRNIEKEKQDLEEYSKQLNSIFPYKDELNYNKERLVEVDNIIIAKAKEIDENKKTMVSLQNECDEPAPTYISSRNL